MTLPISTELAPSCATVPLVCSAASTAVVATWAASLALRAISRTVALISSALAATDATLCVTCDDVSATRLACSVVSWEFFSSCLATLSSSREASETRFAPRVEALNGRAVARERLQAHHRPCELVLGVANGGDEDAQPLGAELHVRSHCAFSTLAHQVTHGPGASLKDVGRAAHEARQRHREVLLEALNEGRACVVERADDALSVGKERRGTRVLEHRGIARELLHLLREALEDRHLDSDDADILDLIGIPNRKQGRPGRLFPARRHHGHESRRGVTTRGRRPRNGEVLGRTGRHQAREGLAHHGGLGETDQLRGDGADLSDLSICSNVEHGGGVPEGDVRRRALVRRRDAVSHVAFRG